MVRLPDGMRDRIAEAARANGRSMNSEVVARLQSTFAAEVAAGPAEPMDIAAMAREIHALSARMVDLMHAMGQSPEGRALLRPRR